MSRIVSRRLTALGFAAITLVPVLGAGCAEDVSPAVRVDGVAVSTKDLLDEVGEWAGNPAAYPPEQLATHNPGTYPMELVTAILEQRIDLELHHAEFEHLDLELTDELRDAAVGGLFQGDMETAAQALGGFSDAYRTEYVDLISEQLAVQDELGADYAAWQTDARRAADIEISPRYGSWNATDGSVTPPEGPKQPASDVLQLGDS